MAVVECGLRLENCLLQQLLAERAPVKCHVPSCPQRACPLQSMLPWTSFTVSDYTYPALPYVVACDSLLCIDSPLVCLQCSPFWQKRYVSGNTVVVKVAEQTPLTALRVGEIALEAGIPAGVLNVLSGDGPVTGSALSKHKGVDKV